MTSSPTTPRALPAIARHLHNERGGAKLLVLLTLVGLAGLVAAYAVMATPAPVPGGGDRAQVEPAARPEPSSLPAQAMTAAPSAEPDPSARHISPAQRDALIAALSGKQGAKVVVAFVQDDREGQAYALEITDLLKASGWDVTGPGGGTWAPQQPVGQGVVVQDGNSPPPGAIALVRAFGDAGIRMGAVVKPETPADQIWIIVGQRG
jgi:hypothetical protein